MNLAANILGAHAVGKLRESAASAVLRIGSDKLTRAQLAQVECYNFVAARSLGEILTSVLKVPNLRHVYNEVPPAALAVPRLGVVSLAVLGAAFEALGIGGATPLESYVKKHTAAEATVVTFETLKAREALELARERQDKKRRKAQRRDKAHAIRVDRFEQKTNAAS